MSGIGWYNGWDPQERTAVTPVQKQALKDGRLARPTHCSLCGCEGSRDWRAQDAVWLHSEDYGNPLDVYHLCRRCHRILHERFDNPAPWLALISAHERGGTEWFENLTMDPASRTRPFEETYPNGVPGPL